MELFRALAIFAEPPAAGAARVAEALGLGELPGADEYTEVFVFQLYPYASVYLGAEGMIGGEARDRVAGFWRALGQVPPAEPDHLSVMLALYARLAELEAAEPDAGRRESWQNARRAFLWEHLLSWLPVYLTKLVGTASSFYREWGMMLLTALIGEAVTVGNQERLPLHLHEAPGLVDPRCGQTEEFLQSLLTPVRSGMILTRADLSRAADKLRLGLRRGERKFILKALFAQDAKALLEWLIEEARIWVGCHERCQEGMIGDIAGGWLEDELSVQTIRGGMFRKIAGEWERKTKTTAALLKELIGNAWTNAWTNDNYYVE